ARGERQSDVGTGRHEAGGVKRSGSSQTQPTGEPMTGMTGPLGLTGSTEKTTLVADDESHILNVVSLKLRNAGYRVLTAQDGQEALDIATAERPDLLITDYHMPELSGLELCRRLQQDAATAGIQKIML